MALDGFMSGMLSCELVGRWKSCFIYIPVCTYFWIGYWLGKSTDQGRRIDFGRRFLGTGGGGGGWIALRWHRQGDVFSSPYKHFCALTSGCARSIRIYEAAFCSCAIFSSFIAFSGPSARSTSLFPFPSTCPSGKACTPGRFDPLSFCFLTFFCDGGCG